jgi:hypothetical protein
MTAVAARLAVGVFVLGAFAVWRLARRPRRRAPETLDDAFNRYAVQHDGDAWDLP